MMNELLLLSGLLLNTAGSILLLFPLLNKNKNIEDDLIVEADEETGRYSQKKHLKGRKIGLLGLGLLASGFILQTVPVVIKIISN